ncbi:LysR family transcriptional regulator [Massilia sp. CFBP9026]|uniref:LysR family transcriptional regulator n=1 Tax=Massilia sp. CFBP9026 TaxID=3096536 RepID=UPI002A6AD5D6|nr:LysR family transcriptional regulator [Massilia sp. CFBP9026]MDY0962502.1 LysR family transcriptional regulator [Massilia sp. CFBP9026]
MQILDVRIFLAVAAGGTLSAAARRLDIGPMQASRRIAALEAELGVRLFHRTTRSLALTAEGEAFAPYAATLAEAEESARGALRPSATRASGLLRLTAPSVFGQAIVLPLLPSLLERHPDLRVDLDLSDRVQDIVGQGLDLALRVATLGDSELVARRLAANPRLLCAAPRYLRAHGTPATLADLERHQCIGLHAVARWPFVVGASLQRRRVDARVLTSSVDAARTAAVQGLGLAMLTFWDVHEHLRAGSLVRVELEDAAMEVLSVWAVTPTRRYVPERVKVFLDALEDELVRLGG